MTKDNPTPTQKSIAEKFGIDISSDSKLLAAARIREIVEPAINPNSTYRAPTQKQIDFASSLGIDISNDSFFVGSVKIDERLSKINNKILSELNLNPGDNVIVKTTFEIDGEQHEYEKEYVVSSIGKNQRVYFKGGKGQSAWPSQIEKINQ